MVLVPRVSDISHHNTVSSFQDAADAGLWGIIHKATQGSNYRDPDYAKRRSAAKAAGLLWGAYHFNDGSDVVSQVANFLRYAQPDTDTLLVLDYEDNPRSNMSIVQAVQFLRLIESKGYSCAIYSGNRLKESIGRLKAADRQYVTQHLLWLCQYGPTPRLPAGFDTYFLWQYTDGVVGPQPRRIAGIHGEVDLNVFNGTREQLEELWLSGASSHSGIAEIDQGDNEPSSHSRAAEADEDAEDNAATEAENSQPMPVPPLPGALRRPSAPTRAVQIAQQQLFDMGYYEVGNIDGRWGGKCVAAISAFYHDRGVSAKPAIDQTLVDALQDAQQDGWQRPISAARANTRPEDLKHSNDAVRLSLWQRLWAKVAVAAGGLGLGGTTLSDTFTGIKYKLQPVEDMFHSIPGSVWFMLMIIVAGAVWYASTRAAQATAKDYNSGRLN
jgi:lysozyme